MKTFVSRIVEHGFNRDEARQARTRAVRKARPSPYVFRYNQGAREFVVEIKFRRSAVSREELREALHEALRHLETEK